MTDVSETTGSGGARPRSTEGFSRRTTASRQAGRAARGERDETAEF
jgi:hypothetical protein